MFHSFSIPNQGQGTYPSIHNFTFIPFSAGTGKSTILQVLFFIIIIIIIIIAVVVVLIFLLLRHCYVLLLGEI